MWQRYDLGPGHPLIGKSAPDLAFEDGARLGNYLQPGRAVLFRFENARKPRIEEHERFRVIWAQCVEPTPANAIFVRPDGYISWAGDAEGEDLRTAFRKWLGVAPLPN